MSEKNNYSNSHEWYSYKHGVAFRVQRFLDFSGSPCIRMKEGTYVPYSVKEIEHNISSGHWLPVPRPADAIAPAYGLNECNESADEIDTTVSVGDVFAWGRHESHKRTNRLRVIGIDDGTVGYEDGVDMRFSSVPIDHAVDLITSDYWRRITDPTARDIAHAASNKPEVSDELTTLRRQYAESLAIIEALLQKYEPETLANIRENSGVVT